MGFWGPKGSWYVFFARHPSPQATKSTRHVPLSSNFWRFLDLKKHNGERHPKKPPHHLHQTPKLIFSGSPCASLRDKPNFRFMTWFFFQFLGWGMWDVGWLACRVFQASWPLKSPHVSGTKNAGILNLISSFSGYFGGKVAVSIYSLYHGVSDSSMWMVPTKCLGFPRLSRINLQPLFQLAI